MTLPPELGGRRARCSWAAAPRPVRIAPRARITSSIPLKKTTHGSSSILGQVRKTSSIVVTNRLDCCPDRAVPLVVELSTDSKNRKVVAKRTTSFDTFRATYATTRARYVKLHVPRPDGILHFKSVRVLP